MITYWAILIATGLAGIGLCACAGYWGQRGYRKRLYRYSRAAVRDNWEDICHAKQQYIERLQTERDELIEELGAERRRARHWYTQAKALARWRRLDRAAWTELPDVRDSITEN